MVVRNLLTILKRFTCIIIDLRFHTLFLVSLFVLKLLILQPGKILNASEGREKNSNPIPVIRHLYLTWQHAPTSTMTLNIHGIKTPDNLVVYYDTISKSSSLRQYAYSQSIHCSKTYDGERKIYHLELKDLKPNTDYFFTIGDHQHSYINEQKFHTVDDHFTELTFIEGGDCDATWEAEKLFEKAAKLNPTAYLLGGDYANCFFDKNDLERWDQWLDCLASGLVSSDGFLIPVVLAIGNHEVFGGFGKSREQVPFFFEYFLQGNDNKGYFALEFGKKIKLFVLDSGHVSLHHGPQLDWLKNELQNSAYYPIKIALYHVPLYPSVRFSEKNFFYYFFHHLISKSKNSHCAEKLFSNQSQEGRKYWLPLFDKYHLTVAFEHHDQALKRTKLLRKDKAHPKGTLYLGDGGWGSKIQYPPIQSYFNSYFEKVQGRVHFFWLIRVKKDEIIYQAIDKNNLIIDQFIQKII